MLGEKGTGAEMIHVSEILAMHTLLRWRMCCVAV